MKNEPDNQKFPWWAIPLIAMASFRFEQHNEYGYSFSYDGTTTAVQVIGIIALVMVFGLIKAVQRILIAHELIDRLPRSRFWVLLPFSIILPGIGYRVISDTGFSSKFTDEYVYHWDFRWGMHPLHLWFIVGTLVIIFLHTAKLTLGEIERSAKKANHKGCCEVGAMAETSAAPMVGRNDV